MFQKKSVIDYPLLLIMSIGKRSFEALGKVAKKSGDSIRRLLMPAEESITIMSSVAQKMFEKSKTVVITIDDTLIKKTFSTNMEGVSLLYDSGLGKEIGSYKLLVCSATDGKHTIPLTSDFLFSKDVLPDPSEFKIDIVKRMILNARTLFSS
jgi:hypothetical protein